MYGVFLQILAYTPPPLSRSLSDRRTVMGEMLSTKVSTEIAAREGVDPLELDEPLYDVIDVGALERLVETAGRRDDGEFEVEFTYYGYDVVVDESGEVTVSGNPSAVGDAAGESADQPATGR
jgi:hypothetical protein